MKLKMFIPLMLTLASCTSVRRDDHSYTYIHNYTNNGEERSKPKFKKEPEADDAPFYRGGLSSNNTPTVGDQQFVQNDAYTPNSTIVPPQSNVVHNHYYAKNGVERPTCSLPPENNDRYFRYNPAGRRFLIAGEMSAY